MKAYLNQHVVSFSYLKKCGVSIWLIVKSESCLVEIKGGEWNGSEEAAAEFELAIELARVDIK